MKQQFILIQVAILLMASCALGQGTFVFDQQSNTDETPQVYGVGTLMYPASFGQSFTPTLPTVGFIRLKFNDGSLADGRGATLYVNLRTDSITGPILSSTAPVTMPNLFTGTTDFYFPTEVPVTPGLVYYFEPVLQSSPGLAWYIDVSTYYNYLGGTAFYNGLPQTSGADLWFREGLVVPEPSSALLGLLGAGMFVWFRRKKCRSR